MANRVTGYTNYGAYPTSIQGYTSPTLGNVSATAYSQYDTKPYHSGAMLSYSTPAPQYSSPYYTNPAASSSLSYNNGAAMYNSYSTSTQSQLQQAMPVAATAAAVQQQAQQQAQQLAAAVSLQRGYQSPPYDQSTAGYSTSVTGSAALYDQVALQYKQATYEAQAAVAAQQAAYQHCKKEIIENYSGGNLLQANILPSSSTQHVLPSKASHLSSQLTSTHRSPSYSKLDTIQSFVSHPAPPKPSSNHRISLSSTSTSTTSSLLRPTEPPLPSNQHIFRKNVGSCYKMPFQKTLHLHNHLCDICKISCASSKTYKDHFEGKRHKKRVAQLEQEKKEGDVPVTGCSYKCMLCDVTCTGEETFNAHRRGIKHYKAEKLYIELGKEIPEPVITGNTEPKPVVPIVGENLIEKKTDPARSSKVVYHCKMCECSFNDEFAKNLHLKGRRHRLNYKKHYDPSLKVEIQPSKREKMVEQKARRRADDMERRRSMVENRRNMWEQNRWRAEEEWREWTEARTWSQYEAIKTRQENEYEETCTAEKENCIQMGLPEPTPPPRPRLPPPPPRINNARFVCPGMDEFLMIQKQTMVCPTDEELETLQELVNSVDVSMRAVSDALYDEAKGKTANTPARLISTMHKTGNLTKAILLNDDLVADIAVLCTEKPTQPILKNVYTKFKELYKCTGDTKITMVVDKGLFTVNKGDAPQFKVNVKLTSPAFEVNVSEDERRIEKTAKVLDRKYCLSVMSEVNEAGWYKINMKPNTPTIVVLRILSSLRLEPGSPLKDLTVQVLQVILYITMKTFGPIKNVAPTLILRRLLEILSTGFLLTEEIVPPWNKSPAIDLLVKLELEERELITAWAQYSLRCIALGDMHKVLQIPPPPRHSPPIYRSFTPPPRNSE